MTEQEKINSDVDKRLSNLETKFEAFMRSHEDFKQEMRDRDNQRAEDIRNRDNQRAEDIRNRDNKWDEEMRNRDNKWDEEMREIRAIMQNMQSNLQNMQASNRTLNIATIIGIAAIVVAVLLK